MIPLFVLFEHRNGQNQWQHLRTEDGEPDAVNAEQGRQDEYRSVMDGTVVSVFDMTGRMVLNECYQGQLDVSSLAPAVYAIKFEDYKVRFVKE